LLALACRVKHYKIQTMALLHSPRIVTDGLVLCLDAANRKSYPGSGNTWGDLSDQGNNGTLTNGPTFNSANGGSIVFDGVDDFVTTGNNLDPIAYGLYADSNSFWSVSSWFKPGGTGAITGKSVGIGPAATYIVWMSTTTILSTRLRGGATLNISTSITSNWNEVVITWNGSTARAYLNGEFVNLISVGGALKQIPNFCIGATSNGSVNRYTGNISNVKVYNRALTQQEVLQNYNALKGRYNL